MQSRALCVLLVFALGVGSAPTQAQPAASDPEVPKAGPHQVSARHPAYQRVTLQVTVRPDESQRVVVDFPKDGVRKE